MYKYSLILNADVEVKASTQGFSIDILNEGHIFLVCVRSYGTFVISCDEQKYNDKNLLVLFCGNYTMELMTLCKQNCQTVTM